MSGRDALELSALITAGLIVGLLAIDFEIRLSGLDHRMGTGFQSLEKSGQVRDVLEQSVLGSGLLTELLETAGQVNDGVNPLLQRLARRELEPGDLVCPAASRRHRDRL